MNIEEAELYLEHTSKDDFNLEEHQKENRYQAIQVVLKEIERLNNIKKKAINELFDLKDMIYKPETREINFDIQNKISSIIKILGSDKE